MRHAMWCKFGLMYNVHIEDDTVLCSGVVLNLRDPSLRQWNNAQSFTIEHGTARDTSVVCYARRKQIASLSARLSIVLTYLTLLLRRFHHIFPNILCFHHLDTYIGYRQDAVVD